MPVARNFNDLQRTVRVLAVMTCPAPEKHEAVVRCCLKPLGEPIVSRLAEERSEDGHAGLDELMATRRPSRCELVVRWSMMGAGAGQRTTAVG